MSVPKWTGDLIGKMHNTGISKKDLAKELNYTPEYVSMVFNGKKEPPGAEERFNKAFENIVAERQAAV